MRFGIIGTNFISKEFVSACRKADGAAVQTVFSRQTATGEAFMAAHGIARAVTSLEELLAEPSVEAVYIASPNRFHSKQAFRALEAGKHVLLEKPACPNAREFEALLQAADRNGVVLMEAMRPVFTPGFAQLRDAVRRVGAVRMVRFCYSQYSSRYDKYQAGIVENAFDPTLCNGALMDLGVYLAHCAVDLFGVPSSVQATAQKLPNGLDAQGIALLSYDGMLAELAYSKIADGRTPCEVQGENGTVLVWGITNPKKIVLVDRNRTETVLYEDATDDFFGMEHEIAAFLKFSQGWEKERLRQIQEHTLQTLQLLDEIRSCTGIDFQ